MTRLERLRIAAALAHTVPGVTLQVTWCDDTTTLVSAHGNGLRPCELRHLVSGAVRFRPGAFVGGMADVAVAGGLADLGSGVYATGCRQGVPVRWLSAFLHPQTVKEIAEDCPHATDQLEVSIHPDQDLGVTVVAIRTHGGDMAALDLTAAWLNTELLVREAMQELTTSDYAP
jgi:hypothetical protein